jgi:hypothetical protein
MAGLSLYIGAPGMGKTTAALRDAAALEKAVFVIDSAGVVKVNGAQVYKSRREAFAAYGAGFSVVYIPKGPADLEALAEGFAKGRHAAVVLDELVYWTSAGYCPPALEKICRLHRHYELDLFFTTQQPQDVPGRVRNCATRVRVFRCSDARSLAAVDQWAPAGIVGGLPPYRSHDWSLDGSLRPA